MQTTIYCNMAFYRALSIAHANLPFQTGLLLEGHPNYPQTDDTRVTFSLLKHYFETSWFYHQLHVLYYNDDRYLALEDNDALYDYFEIDSETIHSEHELAQAAINALDDEGSIHQWFRVFDPDQGTIHTIIVILDI